MAERTMHNGKRIYASSFKAWLVEQARVPGVSVAPSTCAVANAASCVRAMSPVGTRGLCRDA
ncbi:hypothetical protein J2W28_006018 [Variovorax boronicumulans]|uniref:hypothetical protein n=1 Tax=Variovorax boronicumulans TaxID=436515 RepID=UPI0027889109|nr:hypothetical protein [Variovorax boronicumulans]MDP9995690.1 hypothetical protein [Variovorax boronicumulans]MDQ0006845.1 hypothetical protein [Variovorax boronicumulans]